MKNQTRLCSTFQLWNPLCSANKEDSVPPVQTRKAEPNLYKKKEKSLRKCWLVYADSPVKVFPKLLLWKLMWKTHTTPPPTPQHLWALISAATCSYCSLPPLCAQQDALEVCFPHHSSYTHPHFKEEKSALLHLDYNLYIVVRHQH